MRRPTQEATPDGYAGGRKSGRANRSWLALFFFLPSLLPHTVSTSRALADSLPTLTTTRQAHRLQSLEAARAYPVRLRAVVTYYDGGIDPRRRTLFVADSTGSIYVAPASVPAAGLHPADLVEVVGQTAPGDFAPIVERARVRVLGKSLLPSTAPRVSLTGLLTGGYDGQWVEVEGVVRSVRQVDKNTMLELALSDGITTAATLMDPNIDYTALVDARIVMRANTGPLFNHRGQVTGTHLLFPGMATVRVEDPAPPDPFHLPVTRIGRLMSYSPDVSPDHRQHVRGAVTLFWPGRRLCIQDGSGGLCAETAQTARVEPGDIVNVIGFPMNGEFAPTLAHATFVPSAAGAPLQAAAIDAAEAFRGDYDAHLVKVEGQLLGEDRAAPDPTIVLSSGKYIFSVVLPRRSGTTGLPPLEQGSRLQVTGICAVQSDSALRMPTDGFVVPKSFRMLLRSDGDIAVLQRPSWWNAEHTLRVLALALALTMGILGWVVYLRNRLKEQTSRLRHQATHDALTGIWNRRAVLDLLDRECEIAARSQKMIGVMMLDADHFKKINDTCGHLAGDAVLRELAARIQGVVRATDLTGRYGGEEFLIVLPGCTPDEVQDCAERVRTAIATQTIAAEGHQLTVTVSMGTAVLDPSRNVQREALAAADAALYQAKNSGRNRVVSADDALREKQTSALGVAVSARRRYQR